MILWAVPVLEADESLPLLPLDDSLEEDVNDGDLGAAGSGIK